MKMKGLVIALGLVSTTAFAAADFDYATNSSSTVWRNSSGECWHMGVRGEDFQPLVECGDAVVVVEETVVESVGEKVVVEEEAAVISEEGAVVAAAAIVLSDVQFANNSAELPDEFKDELDVIVQGVQADPGVTGLVVTGHTDSSGAAAYNLDLSERRAKSVGDYLTAEGVGVPVTTQGKGESEPVADNATREGRAQNRRVVIDVLR